MKNYWKIGLVTIIIGTILMMIAMMLGGGVSVLNENKIREEKNYTLGENYSKIKITEGNLKVNIVPSYDNNVHLTTFENEDYYYKISENNGLEITVVDKSPWFNIGFNFDEFNTQYYMELSIPTGMIADIDILSSNGGVEIDGVEAQSINIKNNNGKIELVNLATIGDIYVSNNNGSIILEEIKSNDITIENGNGEIYLDTIDANSVDIENNNGKLEINDVYTNNLMKYENNNGSIELENIYTDGSLYINTDNGKINLKDVYFGKEMDIETSNGKIEGNILGKEEQFSF